MTTHGDEARFREAFELHYNEVLAYAIRRTTSRDDAEEIAASTFATAWRRIDRLPAEPMTLSWLYRVAWRTLSNHHRGERRRFNLFERLSTFATPRLSFEDSPPDDPRDGELYEALARLSRKDREVLRLVTWEELSNVEAAEVLDCSPNAFAIRLHRARHALRDELERGCAPRRDPVIAGDDAPEKTPTDA